MYVHTYVYMYVTDVCTDVCTCVAAYLFQDFWYRHFCFVNMGRHYFNLNYDVMLGLSPPFHGGAGGLKVSAKVMCFSGLPA